MMQFRITQAMYQEVRSDLRRSHPFAYERVGYIFIRPSGSNVLAATGYETIPDEFYIQDKNVGARIDHRGIALAMKRADLNGEGILHVHAHIGFGYPKFSRVDLEDHQNFLRSFKNANPNMTHGFLLLSQDKMTARVWTPGNQFYSDIYRCTIIGLPCYHNWSRG